MADIPDIGPYIDVKPTTSWLPHIARLGKLGLSYLAAKYFPDSSSKSTGSVARQSDYPSSSGYYPYLKAPMYATSIRNLRRRSRQYGKYLSQLYNSVVHPRTYRGRKTRYRRHMRKYTRTNWRNSGERKWVDGRVTSLIHTAGMSTTDTWQTSEIAFLTQSGTSYQQIPMPAQGTAASQRIGARIQMKWFKFNGAIQWPYEQSPSSTYLDTPRSRVRIVIVECRNTNSTVLVPNDIFGPFLDANGTQITTVEDEIDLPMRPTSNFKYKILYDKVFQEPLRNNSVIQATSSEFVGQQYSPVKIFLPLSATVAFTGTGFQIGSIISTSYHMLALAWPNDTGNSSSPKQASLVGNGRTCFIG